MAKMLPIFLNLKGRDVLIVGGGNVALEKLNSLLPCQPKITIISKNIIPEILKLKETYLGIRLVEREVEFSDIENRFLVFLATNDRILNSKISDYARNKRILVNSVDDKDSSDFFSAAVFDRGPFRISISTEGKFAGFSKMLKNALVEILPEENDPEWDCLASMRDTIQKKIPEISERKRILGKLISTLEEEYFAIRGNR
ncbi:MAG: bifunctional precorrin-2 dehydrogenase/sirohydrochlorin ferrochelatase [Leptospiraceae bacterium]|nr:bifunctional precorrin-2 dehydrogenase/sirohydrochlorin ferrochelatase [Leptospiraceae bacterium]